MYCPTCRIDLRPMGEHSPPYAAVHDVETKGHRHPITGRVLTMPMSTLEDGRIYRIQSRNLITGVWRAKTQGFTGIREKFGAQYLFEEYHWETGAPFGTAHALYPLDATMSLADQLEDGSKLFALLQEIDKPIIAEMKRRDELDRIEAESRRWAPKTLAQHEKDERLEAVRVERRRRSAEVGSITDPEKRKAAVKEVDEWWQEALRAAIKGDRT